MIGERTQIKLDEMENFAELPQRGKMMSPPDDGPNKTRWTRRRPLPAPISAFSCATAPTASCNSVFFGSISASAF